MVGGPSAGLTESAAPAALLFLAACRSPEPEDPLTGLVGQLDGGERNWSSRDPVADQLDAFVRHDAAGSAAAACSTPSTQLPSRQQQLSDFSPPSVPVAQDWIADHAARLGVEYHEVMAMIMAGKRASTDPSPPASLQSQPPQLSGVRAAALQPDSQEVGRNSSSSTLGWGSSLLGGAGRRPEIAPFAGGGSSSSSPDRSGISSLAGSGGMGAMPPPKRRNLGVVSMLTRSQQSDVTAAGGLNVGRVVEQQRGPSLDRWVMGSYGPGRQQTCG